LKELKHVMTVKSHLFSSIWVSNVVPVFYGKVADPAVKISFWGHGNEFVNTLSIICCLRFTLKARCFRNGSAFVFRHRRTPNAMDPFEKASLNGSSD
jgi:hypothetical protein